MNKQITTKTDMLGGTDILEELFFSVCNGFSFQSELNVVIVSISSLR